MASLDTLYCIMQPFSRKRGEYKFFLLEKITKRFGNNKKLHQKRNKSSPLGYNIRWLFCADNLLFFSGIFQSHFMPSKKTPGCGEKLGR